MIEGIAALIEGMIALMAACFNLIGLLLQSLGYAGWHLSSQPKEGESRFSPKRLLLAFLPVLVIAVGIPGAIWFASWRMSARKRQIESTREIVESIANSVTLECDADGRVIWPTKVEIPPKDVWGNPYQLNIEEHAIHQTLTVTSLGPDGIEGGLDITARRSIMLSKVEVGRKAVGSIKDKVKERLGIAEE